MGQLLFKVQGLKCKNQAGQMDILKSKMIVCQTGRMASVIFNVKFVRFL